MKLRLVLDQQLPRFELIVGDTPLENILTFSIVYRKGACILQGTSLKRTRESYPPTTQSFNLELDLTKQEFSADLQILDTNSTLIRVNTEEAQQVKIFKLESDTPTECVCVYDGLNISCDLSSTTKLVLNYELLNTHSETKSLEWETVREEKQENDND